MLNVTLIKRIENLITACLYVVIILGLLGFFLFKWISYGLVVCMLIVKIKSIIKYESFIRRAKQKERQINKSFGWDKM